MAYSKITVNVPDIKKVFRDYNKPHIKEQNGELIRNIDRKYGLMIAEWGNKFQIQDGVLIAFIATESGGQANVSNFCCVGLMQVSPPAVLESATKFQQITKNPLPFEVEQALNKVIPNFLSLKTLSASHAAKIKQKLFDPEFNIMCGTMLLRWLLERFSTILTGAQLNKAIIAYNAGAYRKELNRGAANPIKIPVDTTTYVNLKSIPFETRTYLVKMLGVDGFLYLIYKDKVI